MVKALTEEDVLAATGMAVRDIVHRTTKEDEEVEFSYLSALTGISVMAHYMLKVMGDTGSMEEIAEKVVVCVQEEFGLAVRGLEAND